MFFWSDKWTKRPFKWPSCFIYNWIHVSVWLVGDFRDTQDKMHQNEKSKDRTRAPDPVDFFGFFFKFGIFRTKLCWSTDVVLQETLGRHYITLQQGHRNVPTSVSSMRKCAKSRDLPSRKGLRGSWVSAAPQSRSYHSNQQRMELYTFTATDAISFADIM